MPNIYSRHNLTTYPASYDHLYKKQINATTGAIEYVDETGAKLSTNVGNAAAFLTAWENKKDLVKAEHVIVLQDMLFAMQRTLGVNPQKSPRTSFPDPNNPGQTIAGTAIPNMETRLRCIEGIIPDDTHINSLVNVHVHGTNGLSAINLTSGSGQVSGLLPRQNILTDITSGNSINAGNLYVSAGVSIATALSQRLSLSGGTITGGLIINGSLEVKGSTKLKTMMEVNANELTIGNGGVKGSRLYENSTGSICNTLINQSRYEASLCKTNFSHLKYGRYTAIVRLYFNTNGAAMPGEGDIVFKLVAGSSSNGATAVRTVTGKYINDGNYFNNRYRSYCITFDYGSAPSDVKDPTLSVNYFADTPFLIGCDGITIVPAHTAIL